MVNLTEDQLKDIRNFGALNYPVSKIISILMIDDDDGFNKEFENENSEVRKRYNSGKDEAQYLIDMRIFELARSGDLKAIQLWR